MNWQTFVEINRGLFALPKKPWTVSFWKLAATVVTVAGVIGAYFHAPDTVVHELITSLVTFPAAKADDAISSWDHANHAVLRVAVSLILLGVVYAGAFAVAAQDRLDYRAQLARRLGVKFSSVRREHDILNLEGDCRTSSLEEFSVAGIYLSHVDRHLQVTAQTTWSDRPEVLVEGLPQDTEWSVDLEDRGPRRAYVLNFIPALHQTEQAVRLKIAEVIPRGFFMFEESTPEHFVFDSRVETVSWFVIEPIDRLELSVTFPYNYRVRGQSQFSVRYKSTRTVHSEEERRLRDGGAVSSQVLNGKQTLKLKIDQPLIGLQYYLYWETPKTATKTAKP